MNVDEIFLLATSGLMASDKGRSAGLIQVTCAKPACSKASRSATRPAMRHRTLRDWYLSHLENNDDGSGLISTIAIRDAALNGLGVHLLISFMTRKLRFLLCQATSSMTE